MAACTPPAGGPLDFPMVPPPPGMLGLCPIESVLIRGRMWYRPYVSYSTSAELLTLHFGDEQLEAQWASVEFSLDQMCEMAAALVASQNGGVLPAEAALALRALNPRIK